MKTITGTEISEMVEHWLRTPAGSYLGSDYGNNAKDLLKGAKRVPTGTLFFMGTNGQLYMRTGPYLEGDGSFKFGSGS